MLGLTDINRLTHKIENVFDAARNDSLEVSRSVVDVILSSLDRLTSMIDRLSEENTEPLEYESIVEELSCLLEGDATPKKPNTATQATSESTEKESAPESNHKEPTDPFAEIEDVDNVPEKYMTIFIDETDESLRDMSDALEGEEAIDLSNLLALGHRIKGSAASIGLNKATRLAHCMEDIIQDLRDNDLQPAGEVLETLVATVDCLLDYVQSLRSGANETKNFAETYQKLQQVREQVTQSKPKPLSSVPPAESSNISLENELEQFLEKNQLELNESSRRVAGCIKFIANLPLAGMKARLLLDRLIDVGHLVCVEPPEQGLDEIADLTHLNFLLETAEPVDQLKSKVFADGVDDALLKEINPSASCEDDKTDEQKETNPQPIGTCPAEPSTPAESTTQQARAKKEEPPKDKQIETIRVDIDRLDHLMNQAGQLVINKARFSRVSEQFKTLASRKQTSHSQNNANTLLSKIESDVESVNSTKNLNAFSTSIESHIQQLQTELQSIHNDIAEMKNVRLLVNDLGEAVHQLDRVAEGIQKSVMDTRMVPIGPLFGRFKRVVRDYTKGSGKDIRLVIRGDKTELDKRMIDELGDPLIHMVRNSADHGIELPEDRAKINKPMQGTITLDAFHRGNQVFVQVQDDGRGLDQEKIKAKAISKGIVSPEEAERLSPNQVFQLIWEPGFSTAEQVTEISGRGMGMDIVHSKLEKLNGSVEIDSQVNVGTTITIKLPLTMAILPSLLTVIKDDVFAIPVESVLEIVRVQSEQMSTVHGARTAVIRGRVVSIVELRELLNFKNQLFDFEDDHVKEKTLVIIGTKGQEIGLVVDGLLGEEDIVIKSLAENYRNVNGLAGASILGDGRVSLILDVSAITDLACSQQMSMVEC